MKRLLGKWNKGRGLIVAAGLAMFSFNSFAHEGQCVTSKEVNIGHLLGLADPFIYVTNTSNSSVDVEVKVFDQDGVRLTEFPNIPSFKFTFGANFTVNPFQQPATLGSQKTGYGLLSPETARFGIVKVEWTSDTCLVDPIYVDSFGFSKQI